MMSLEIPFPQYERGNSVLYDDTRIVGMPLWQGENGLSGLVRYFRLYFSLITPSSDYGLLIPHLQHVNDIL